MKFRKCVATKILPFDLVRRSSGTTIEIDAVYSSFRYVVEFLRFGVLSDGEIVQTRGCIPPRIHRDASKICQKDLVNQLACSLCQFASK